MVYGPKPKYLPYYLFLLGLLINYAPKSYAEINLDKNISNYRNFEHTFDSNVLDVIV